MTRRQIFHKKCNFPDCNAPISAKGYCCGHYAQFKKGKTLSPLQLNKSVPGKFGIKVGKEKLLELVNKNLSIADISKELGYSENVIRRWIHKYEIIFAPKNICLRCGTSNDEDFDKGRHGKCNKCRRTGYPRDNKKDHVKYKGGCCQICGYNKCLASLDFHHINPEEKDVAWTKMRQWKLEKIIKELDKCILVCKNCHYEIHFNENIDKPINLY